MDSFDDIEKRYQKIPVDYVSDGKKVSGLLSLNKKQSEIILSSEQPIKFKTEESGWFDFFVKAADGKSILFHNALTAGTTYHSWGPSQQCEEHIFPNVVIISPENLTEHEKVKSLTFRILGLESFFHYRHVEHCFLHNISSEDMGCLQRLVGEQSKSEAFFDPLDLYITHRPQQAFNLQCRSAFYEVYFSGTFSGGCGGDARQSYYPIARIIFEKPQSIDDALDAIWEWKRFFSQLAMVDLPVTAIAFYGTDESVGGAASVYLPNVRSDSEPENERQCPHPGDIAFNFWEDREKMKDVLSCWLSKDQLRGDFRSLLSWVIKEMNQRVSPNDILTLCSAIESLDELSVAGLPSKENIQILAEGAMAAAQSKGIDIERARVQSILAMLGKPSLPAKLQLLMDRVSAFVPEEDAKKLIAQTHKIRTKVAHGDFIREPMMPLIGPVTEALAGICVLFDLLDCGIPLKSHSDTLVYPAQKIKAALVAIKRIGN